MSKHFTSVAAVLTALLVFASLGFTLSPQLLNVQGVLTDGSGNPLANGSYSVVFSIWSEEVDGDVLWIESHNPVETDGSGVFSVILGSSTTLNPNIFEDTAVWLQMKVGTDDPMTPRMRLTGVPYALRSGGVWSIYGNANLGSAHFLGTTDETELVFKVADTRVLRLYPPPDNGDATDDAPNIVGGFHANTISSDVNGATISGGGLVNNADNFINEITKNQGTIGGGAGNKVNGAAGVVAGGWTNSADGDYSAVAGGYACAAMGNFSYAGGKACSTFADYSFAAGYKAKVESGHYGSFLWADRTEAPVSTSNPNQFLIRAANGVIIGGGVDGTVKVMDASDIEAVRLNGETHAIRLQNSLGEMTIKHDGEAGKITLYPSGSSTESIRLNAESGAVTAQILRLNGGGDLAEPFQMTGDARLPEGTVVIVDENNPGHTTISQSAYDPHVAGIISGAGNIKPGLTLSQSGVLDRGQNVALTGRVYCLATAANGAIKPGDMLTTSDIPGHAMKATDRERAFGSVIGKAMTSLNAGEGLVLVLVGLQ